MVEIINKSSAVKHLPENGIVLQPGINKVDRELFKENLENPLVKESVDNGILKIKGGLEKPQEEKEEQPQGEQEKKQEIEKDLPNPDKFTVDNFLDTFVSNEDRPEVLKKYIEVEQLNQGRTTLITPIREKLEKVK